jgi:hypothetical protein
MNKVMHLDMFCFEYSPIFSETEKVLYRNGQIVVTYKSKVKELKPVDVCYVNYDSLFGQRLSKISEKPWTREEVVNSLKIMGSQNHVDRDKYRLLYCNEEDLKEVSFDFMIDTLVNFNYAEEAFEYIAYNA